MTIEDDIDFLEKVPTLRVLGPTALRILAIGAENQSIPSGDTLFSAGDKADAGYVIQQGSFRLKANPSEGDDKAAVAGPGSLLGEIAMLRDTVRPMTAVAAEESTVMRIPRSLFLKMLEGFPDAAQRLRNHLAARADRTADEIRGVRTSLDPRMRGN